MGLTDTQRAAIIKWLKSMPWWNQLPYERLEGMLIEARKCIKSVEDRSIFGIGGDGITHWYLADELLANIDEVLGGELCSHL